MRTGCPSRAALPLPVRAFPPTVGQQGLNWTDFGVECQQLPLVSAVLPRISTVLNCLIGTSLPAMQEVYETACASLGCSAIPHVTQQLAQLPVVREELNLQGNGKELFNSRLTDVQVVALTQALRGQTVSSLNLAYNELGNTAAKALAQLLVHIDDSDESASSTGLKELNLSSNRITAEGAAVLVDALSQPGCQLQKLILSHNCLGDTGVSALASALQTNKSLQHLDISNTDVADKGIICLAATLAENNSGIRSLCINSPLLQQRPQHDTITHLARMLACNSSIQMLQLSKAGLTDSAVEILVKDGLLRNSSVTQLDLSANRFSPLAGEHLYQLLSSSRGQAIGTLDLSHNRLEDAGAKRVAASLSNCKALTHLNLAHNSVGDAGIVALLEAAGRVRRLQELKLWGNKFGFEASQKLRTMQQQPGREKLVPDVVTYVVDGTISVAAVE